MRLLAIFLIVAAWSVPAFAQAICHPGTTRHVPIGPNVCAPVDGAIVAKQAGCGSGLYCPDGSCRSAGKNIAKAHSGADLTAAVGTDVFSAAGGELVMVATMEDTSGLQVNIKHVDGRVTRYFHLSSSEYDRSQVGRQIDAGEKIGLSGTTGNARMTKCPHLHLELRREVYAKQPSEANPTFSNATLNPMAWLKAGVPPSPERKKQTAGAQP